MSEVEGKLETVGVETGNWPGDRLGLDEGTPGCLERTLRRIVLRPVRFRRAGADFGPYHAPLAERWTRRLKGPKANREHPKGAPASLGFLVLGKASLGFLVLGSCQFSVFSLRSSVFGLRFSVFGSVLWLQGCL